MAKAPAFQFYASDFLTDTMDWSDEEVGVHVRLLSWSWINRRGIPRDGPGVGARALRISAKVADVWDVISEKWVEGPDNTWINEKLEETRQKQDKFRESQKIKSEKAAEARRLRSSGDSPTGKPTGKPTGIPIEDRRLKGEDEVEVVDEGVKIEVWPTFEDFWDAYGKKIDRPKCLRAWGRLSQKDREAIMDHVPRYVAATPETKYRRNPLTYLNGENWNDDELTRTTAPDRPGLDRARREAERLAAMYADETSGDVTG